MSGPGDLGAYLAVLFRAPVWDLLDGERHGLHLLVRPGPPWVMIPTDRTDRWVFSMTWDPATESLDDYPRERLVELVRAAAGAPDLPVDIVWTGDFTFTALIADAYRDRRLFLVGDAAHRMTPRGAAGMNTAIHDGYDLGWKLGWVLRGWADESLLDSYEAERRPVGVRNVERSAVEAARRDVSQDYLDELTDRIPHTWLADGRSTLDVLGEGLTVLAGPDGRSWLDQAAALRQDGAVPVDTYVVDGAAAEVLGIGSGGAVLVRPDGRPTTRWSEAQEAPALGRSACQVLFDQSGRIAA
jgi:putative polyketide hydroxylase